MAQIIPHMSGDDLCLEVAGKTYPVIPKRGRAEISIWRDRVSACKVGGEVNGALTDFMGEPIALYKMDRQSQRRVDKNWGQGPVSFADGYPVLVTTTASLADLSKTAGEALSMARFRPNIVIKTHTPWAEDEWAGLTFGESEREEDVPMAALDLVQPCGRCLVTTLDPETGVSMGQGVMKAMIDQRKSNDPRNPGVMFGVNATVKKADVLHIGMAVQPVRL